MHIFFTILFILGAFLGYFAFLWTHVFALVIFIGWVCRSEEIEALIPLGGGVLYFIGCFFGNVVYIIANPKALEELKIVITEFITLFPIWR